MKNKPVARLTDAELRIKAQTCGIYGDRELARELLNARRALRSIAHRAWTFEQCQEIATKALTPRASKRRRQ